MSEYRKKAGVRKLRSINVLVSELEISEVKGALYNLFHHTGIDAFVKMATGGSVWLSRIDQMNDGTEVFKDADRTYAFCLSAKPTENVGMWIAYGLPRREAIRENKNDSKGMPSVIVGPWSSRESFVKIFREKLKGISCKWQDKIEYFLSQATDDDRGLIRESEYKGKINLGRCDRCTKEKRRSCECAYCEGEQSLERSLI